MTNMANSYQSAQSLESKRMLYDLLADPSKYELWFERYAGGLIFRVGYGKTIVTGEEEHVRKALHVVHTVERIASPGSYLVDTLPFLRHLPEWIAPFKKEGRLLHEAELSFFKTLVRDVRAEVDAGIAAPSFVRTWLEDQDAFGLSEDEASYVIGTLFEAGSGTTASAMMSFVLALTLYPEWQQVSSLSNTIFLPDLALEDESLTFWQRMWDELDQVVGDRMPEFEDVPNLPVCRATIKEVLRWRPVTAGGKILSPNPLY
jgi:cytochrome P450